MNNTISAVIYDMDGVLIDSEPLWHKAEILSFATVGVSLTQQMCLQTTGLRIDEVVEYWFARYPWKEVSQKQVEERIWKSIIQLVKDHGKAKVGVIESLTFFKMNGYDIGLASTSAMVLIDVVLQKLGIQNFFSVVHSAEFEEFGKPHPGVYLTTANKMKVAPRACIAIEDSINGMVAAKAAKMKCIGVPEDVLFGDKRLGIADCIIPSLLDIDTNLLESLS